MWSVVVSDLGALVIMTSLMADARAMMKVESGGYLRDVQPDDEALKTSGADLSRARDRETMKRTKAS